MQFVWHLLQKMLCNVMKKNIIFVFYLSPANVSHCSFNVQSEGYSSYKEILDYFMGRLKNQTRITL